MTLVIKGILKSVPTGDYDYEWVECEHCGSEAEYVECYDCGGDGTSHHDCGEDTCCCLDPEPNVLCNTCTHEGGWYVCPNCKDTDNKHYANSAEELK